MIKGADGTASEGSRAPQLERQVTLQQMRIFKSAVEHKNFTRAAEALCLTQPAVTQQIQALEKTFGQPLFAGRGAQELTTMGRTAYERMCRILADVRELDEAAADTSLLANGSVHVAGDSTFGTYVLPRAVAAFQNQSPAVRVHMSVARGSSIRDRLLQRDADLGVVGHLWNDDRIVSRPLLENELRCFCAPTHPLSYKDRVRLEDLARRVLLMRESKSGSSETVERLFRDRGVSLDAAMEISDNEARKRAAIEGLGVAVLSTYAVRAEVAAGLLVPLRAEGFPLRRTWHSVWLRHLKQAPSVESFRQYLCAGAWRKPVPTPTTLA